MVQKVVLSFLPWILFFILAGQAEHQLETAIIIAAIASIALEMNGLKKGFVLSWGTLLFFIFMLIAIVLLKNKWVATHYWLFSDGALATIAWMSIFIRKPFTIQYAKEEVPQERWQHPLFLKINYLLTATWGLIFLVGICIHIIKIYEPALSGWSYELVSYLPSAFGIWFSAWFPNWYKERYMAKRMA